MTPDPATPRLREDVTCARCGRFGAVEMGDQHLCPDCVQEACSCCPEFEPPEARTPEREIKP